MVHQRYVHVLAKRPKQLISSEPVYTIFYEESSSYTHRPVYYISSHRARLFTSLINGTSMFDEGSGSGGYLPLLMGTVPIGLLLVVIGMIVKLLQRRKPKTRKLNP